MRIDLNADLGESFGNYTIGVDERVIEHISSANIACGFHASDPLVMQKTVEAAKTAGVSVGAHPGFPDLVGFGRRNMNVTPKELKAMVMYQIGALSAFCKSQGIALQHVKPHGAMYNMAAKDEALAIAIAEAIKDVDDSLILLGLAGSKLIEAAEQVGISAANEVFADRAYMRDGSLVPRTMEGAVIHDESFIVDRIIKMIESGKVKSIDGQEVSVRADSICLHGDNEKAALFAEKLKKELIKSGIDIVPLAEVIKK